MNILYIRTSTADQNPSLQIADLKTMCSDNPIILPEKESAWAENVNRPEFENIIKLIRKNKVRHLYCWDLDRLYRNRKRLVEFFLLCKQYNCKIHSYRQAWLEQINAMPAPWAEIMQELMINIFGWIAEEESAKKSERTKLAIRKAEGEVTKSYKGNKWGRKKLPPQTITRVMVLANQGLSTRAIAKQVMIYDKNNNARNISASAVRNIITAHK